MAQPVVDKSEAHGATRIERHPPREDVPAASMVTFTFDGNPVAAREGEPILAALLAAGVRVLRTMPISGDVRGGYCLIGRCPDCAVVVDGVPNIMACLTPVTAGLRVRSQHGLGDRESPS